MWVATNRVFAKSQRFVRQEAQKSLWGLWGQSLVLQRFEVLLLPRSRVHGLRCCFKQTLKNTVPLVSCWEPAAVGSSSSCNRNDISVPSAKHNPHQKDIGQIGQDHSSRSSLRGMSFTRPLHDCKCLQHGTLSPRDSGRGSHPAGWAAATGGCPQPVIMTLKAAKTPKQLSDSQTRATVKSAAK